MIKKLKKYLNKISSQFLFNYFMAFILSFACLFIIFMIVGKHMDKKFSVGIYNYEEIISYISDHTLEELYNKYLLPKGSFLELLNNDNTIIDSYNSAKTIGYQYTWDELNNLIYSDTALNVHLDYGETLIIYMSDTRYLITESYIKTLYIVMFLSILFSILLIITFFSRISAKMIVKPIKVLVDGVDKISMGDYSSRIYLRSQNELGILKDSINTMAETIDNEISFREKIEENKKRLILDISHDLKTPLTNIQGYSESLTLSQDLSSETKQLLSIIISNSKKANKLLNDLVDLSHLDAMENPSFSKINICEFTRELLIDYIPEFESKGIELEVDIPDEIILLNINEQKLTRAISNIINNAIKYVKISPKLKLCIYKKANSVFLSITDNGNGIPIYYVDEIFEPFVRLDSSRNSKTGGAGLGLSISKAIIELHKGKLFIDKTYRDGARFIMEFPLK